MNYYIVYYKGRGSEFKFQSPGTLTVRAYDTKDARSEAIDRIGDIYKIVRVVKLK